MSRARRGSVVDVRPTKESAGTMTVYLDNDVCSTVSRRDRETADLAALDALLGLGRSQIISIATSRHSVREMERAPAAYQSELKSGLHEMTFAQDDHRVLGSHTQVDPYWGCICSPLVTPSPNSHR